MYQALYRKWRPMSFDDVVSQPHVTTTLKNQIKKDFDTLLQKSDTAYMFETIEKVSQKYGVTIHTFGGKKKA